jgi:dUTP pyrophosphatase
VLLLNTDREQPFIVETGARIAQLLIVPFLSAAPVEVSDLSESERGGDGFGSSGG